MPAPTTIDEFLDLVRKSGVVDEKRLDALPGQGCAPPAPLPAEPGQVRRRPGPRRHPDPLPGRAVPPGQVAPLHHRQVQGAGTPRLRRHGQRLPVRTQADAPPGRRQGAADRQGRRPRRRSSASTARPAPSPPSTTPTSSAPTTSTRTTSCTSSSWSTWTAPACRRSSRRPGRWTCCGPPTTSARRPSACSTPTRRPAWSTATSSRATSSSTATASSRSSTWAWPASSTTRTTSSPRSTTRTSWARPTTSPRSRRSTATASTSGPTSTAWAATFYFCLTGRTPFAEGTVAQKLIWHQTRQPKPIRQTRPDVPEELAAVIEKMMAKDPAQRHRRPLEVAEALAPWTQTPIPPPPDEEMPRLSPAALGLTVERRGGSSVSTPGPRVGPAVVGPAQELAGARPPPARRGRRCRPAARPTRRRPPRPAEAGRGRTRPTRPARVAAPQKVPPPRPSAAPRRRPSPPRRTRASRGSSWPPTPTKSPPAPTRRRAATASPGRPATRRLDGTPHRAGLLDDRKRVIIVVSVVAVVVLGLMLAGVIWAFAAIGAASPHSDREAAAAGSPDAARR